MDTVSLFFDGMLGLSAASANDLTTTQVCLRAVVIYIVLIFLYCADFFCAAREKTLSGAGYGV
jgi:uncharacterized RDD family membrane protein YckC